MRRWNNSHPVASQDHISLLISNMIYSKTESDKLFDLRSINGYLRNRLNCVVAIACILNILIVNISSVYTDVLWNLLNLLCMIVMVYGMSSHPLFKGLGKNSIGDPSSQTHMYSLTQLILHLIANYLFIKSIMFYVEPEIIGFNVMILCSLCIMYCNINSMNVDVKTVERADKNTMIMIYLMSGYHMLMFFTMYLYQSTRFCTLMSFACSVFITFHTSSIQKTHSPVQISIFSKEKMFYLISMFIMIWTESGSLMIVGITIDYMAYRSLDKKLDTKMYIILFLANLVMRYVLHVHNLIWFVYILCISVSTIVATREAILWRNKRTYCCGVFDIMHEGHMVLFKNMSKHGDVIVGVLDDETVKSYKRTPVMTHKERCDAVKIAKYVDEIIPHCPLYTDSAFLKEHDIDVVGIGEEYFKPPYKYYEDCVRENKYVIMPRYEGISTSDLIKRIQTRKDLN